MRISRWYFKPCHTTFSALPAFPARTAACRAIRAEVSRMVAESKLLPVLILDEAHHLRNEVLEEL